MQAKSGQSRRGVSIRTARRADRRLREAAKNATAIALIGTAPDDADARIEHACLTIKSATATQTGIQALARLRGERADHAQSLAERIRRHAREADAALDRVGVALVETQPDDAQNQLPMSVARARWAERVRRGLIRSSAAVAAVLALAVVAVAIVIVPLWPWTPEGSQSARDGTLAGNEFSATSPVASSEPADADAPASSPAEATLTVDFDGGRMGQGLGTEWLQTAGGSDAVVLAPIPNAVNRSARLESIDVAGAEACRPIAPGPVPASRLFVEVLLSEPTTTAIVIARDASGAAELRMTLGPLDSTLASDGASPLASGGGLPAGEWLRAEIVARDGQTSWRVEGVSSGTFVEETMDVDALRAIDEVCLAVSTDSTGGAHFDNLTVVIPEEG